MARSISVQILGDASSLLRAFKSSSRSAQTWNRDISGASRGAAVATLAFRGLGGSVAAAAGAFIGGFGLVTALKRSVSAFASFQRAMQESVGLAGVAQERIAGFSAQIKAIGPDVGKSPQELARAFYFVASSGIAVGKAMDVVRVSAKASAAGLGETATVADAVTSVLNAYGQANMSAAQAADVLVATVREGKGEADQFAGVIGNVAALASQLGVSFNEVGAALAAQTRLGTDAETASTQLQRVFSSLVKISPQSAKAFRSVGLDADQLREDLGEKGLLFVLRQVQEAFKGNLPALSKAFGDVRAVRGVLSLVGKSSREVEAIFKRMGTTAGATEKAFAAVSDTTSFKFDQMKAAAEVAGISIGAVFAPLAGTVAESLSAAADEFAKFSDKIAAAKGFTAKINVVTTGLQGFGERVGREALREFDRIDFRQAASVASDALVDALDGLADAVSRVDWGKVGREVVRRIVRGLVDTIKGTNWKGLFKGLIRLSLTAIRAYYSLLFGAGKELVAQLLRGVQEGGKLALLYVQKFALQLVEKLTGATSFLGRFDPFKGVKERATIRLREIQAEIDRLHGKSVTVEITTVVRTGAGGSALAAKEQDVAKLEQDARRQGDAEERAAETVADARRSAARAATLAAAAAEKAREEAVKAFQKLMDSFSLKADVAASTKSLQDDIAVQKQIQAALRKQMQVEGETVDLQRQLFESRQRVAEFQRRLAEDRATSRRENQFVQLGLTAEGDRPVPGAGSLRKKANSLREQIKGTVLDTPKTASELARIAKVLSGKFGKAGRDVRQAILDMLNDIQGALDGRRGKGPLTKLKKADTNALLGDLGLDPEQIKALRARLSRVGQGGFVPGRGTGSQFGAQGAVAADGAVGRVIHIANLTVVSNDPDDMLKKLQRKARRNTASRRGTNAGRNGGLA